MRHNITIEQLESRITPTDLSIITVGEPLTFLPPMDGVVQIISDLIPNIFGPEIQPALTETDHSLIQINNMLDMIMFGDSELEDFIIQEQENDVIFPDEFYPTEPIPIPTKPIYR